MSNQGWIKLHRKIQDHWIWEDAQKLKWWLDLIILANHQDKKVLLGNKLMTIEKGEHHTSELKLAKRWGVSKTTVRKFLSLLESDGMIELKKSKKGTTLKVSNYNDYQGFSEEEKPQKNHKETIKEPQKNHEVYTNKNVNNDKNEKNDKNKTLAAQNSISADEIKDLNDLRTWSKQNLNQIANEDDAKLFINSLKRINVLISVNQSLLVKYIECIRMTRSNCKISSNVIINILDKFTKYDIDVIHYALATHITKHDDKKEAYTVAIMRNTSASEARQKLAKLLNKQGGEVYEINKHPDEPEYEYGF